MSNQGNSQGYDTESEKNRDCVANDAQCFPSECLVRLRDKYEDLKNIEVGHANSKVARKIELFTGNEKPTPTDQAVPVWIREGWTVEVEAIIGEAQNAGPDSLFVFVYIPCQLNEEVRKAVASVKETEETVNTEAAPRALEGSDLPAANEQQKSAAEHELDKILTKIFEGARVFIAGGNEVHSASTRARVEQAVQTVLERLDSQLREAEDLQWKDVAELAKQGDRKALKKVFGFKGAPDKHPLCAAVIAFVAAGKKGSEIRQHLSPGQSGGSDIAVDSALVLLSVTGRLRVTHIGKAFDPRQLDHPQIGICDFSVEHRPKILAWIVNEIVDWFAEWKHITRLLKFLRESWPNNKEGRLAIIVELLLCASVAGGLTLCYAQWKIHQLRTEKTSLSEDSSWTLKKTEKELDISKNEVNRLRAANDVLHFRLDLASTAYIRYTNNTSSRGGSDRFAQEIGVCLGPGPYVLVPDPQPPPQQQTTIYNGVDVEKYVALAKQHGITTNLIITFFRKLGEPNLPESEWGPKLDEFVERYQSLKKQLSRFQGRTQEGVLLQTQGFAALESGDLEGANQFLIALKAFGRDTLATIDWSSRWTNSLGMVFVPAAPGKKLLVSIYETRVRDFTNYFTPNTQTWVDANREPDQPVVMIDYTEATMFYAWLTGTERSKLPEGAGYRLPLDSEWSLLVGLTNEMGAMPKQKDSKILGIYPWGTHFPPRPDEGNYGFVSTRIGLSNAIGGGRYSGQVAPVGSLGKGVSPLFDLGGNVWEICFDAYDENGQNLVARGGSWLENSEANLLSSKRLSAPSSTRTKDLGFRLVLDAQYFTVFRPQPHPAAPPFVPPSRPSAPGALKATLIR